MFVIVGESSSYVNDKSSMKTISFSTLKLSAEANMRGIHGQSLQGNLFTWARGKKPASRNFQCKAKALRSTGAQRHSIWLHPFHWLFASSICLLQEANPGFENAALNYKLEQKQASHQLYLTIKGSTSVEHLHCRSVYPCSWNIRPFEAAEGCFARAALLARTWQKPFERPVGSFTGWKSSEAFHETSPDKARSFSRPTLTQATGNFYRLSISCRQRVQSEPYQARKPSNIQRYNCKNWRKHVLLLTL